MSVTTIRKTATLPYTSGQMYTLVNDIESYPEFLPWCSEAQVHERYDDRLKASLTLKAGKLEHTLMTENSMEEDRLIQVRLIEGPFKHLTGSWHFRDQDDSRCHITLEMQFEFKNRILKMALNKTFNKIVNSLVDAFSQRARELYDN
ncbi:MAG: type II toxin-antitoxin system RatA family toxin [Gammaproteobacteria bacterium]|nr:type II toxin-antitoxin system RatA family toxin [Gammaproteobacteria bacterium]